MSVTKSLINWGDAFTFLLSIALPCIIGPQIFLCLFSKKKSFEWSPDFMCVCVCVQSLKECQVSQDAVPEENFGTLYPDAGTKV